MTSMWSPGQLRRLDASAELEIAVQRLDGTMHPLGADLGRLCR
jgi:hypothetical protein